MKADENVDTLLYAVQALLATDYDDDAQLGRWLKLHMPNVRAALNRARESAQLGPRRKCGICGNPNPPHYKTSPGGICCEGCRRANSWPISSITLLSEAQLVSAGAEPSVIKLHSTMDAAVWAREFKRICDEKGYYCDEGWMLSWFANAIMVGWDFAKRATPARQIAAEQAEDEGLWCIPETILEAQMQKALRRLTEAVEGKTADQCAVDAIIGKPQTPQVKEV